MRYPQHNTASNFNCFVHSIFLFAVASFILAVSAQSATTDEKRALIARDVCSGFSSKFISTEDDSADVSFSQGRFTIKRNKGSVTVFEDSVPVTKIPGFTFTDYQECIESLIAAFERSRSASASKKNLEAFNAGYELNFALSIGVCLESAARGGMYLGNTEVDPPKPMDREELENQMFATSKSISARVKVITGEEIETQLNDDLMFYEFVPNRVVPYFETSMVDDYMSELLSATEGDQSEYVKLGAITAQMARVLPIAIVLNQFLSEARQRNDPRSIRLQRFLPSSLDCMKRHYSRNAGRLEQLTSELSVDAEFEVPQLQDLFFGNTPEELNTYFDRVVTSPIRKFLRQN